MTILNLFRRQEDITLRRNKINENTHLLFVMIFFIFFVKFLRLIFSIIFFVGKFGLGYQKIANPII